MPIKRKKGKNTRDLVRSKEMANAKCLYRISKDKDLIELQNFRNLYHYEILQWAYDPMILQKNYLGLKRILPSSRLFVL